MKETPRKGSLRPTCVCMYIYIQYLHVYIYIYIRIYSLLLYVVSYKYNHTQSGKINRKHLIFFMVGLAQFPNWLPVDFPLNQAIEPSFVKYFS